MKRLKRRPQPRRPQSQQRLRPVQTADRAFQFETVPLLCTIADVCGLLRISERSFHYAWQRKQLALVEVRGVTARPRLFTGESVIREIKLRAARIRPVAQAS